MAQNWLIRSFLLIAAAQAVAAVAAAEVAIRVAVPAPVSGLQTQLGVGVHTAAGIVVAEINARGDGGRAQIELVLTEDPCSSLDGARAAHTLVAAQVNAVIGFPCRSTATAAGPVFGRSGVLAILTAALPTQAIGQQAIGPQGIGGRAGPAVFHMPVAAQAQGAVIAARLVASSPELRVAIIRDKTAQAVAVALSVELALRASGRGPVAVEAFSGGDKSFNAMVGRLTALGITHVVLVAFPVEGALIARELVAVRPDIEIYGPDFLLADATPVLAGAALARMRVVRAMADPYGAGAEGRRLMERLTAQGVEASREALVVATAIEAYAVAVGQAGSVTSLRVAAELARGVDTRFGRVAFNERGLSVTALWGW